MARAVAVSSPRPARRSQEQRSAQTRERLIVAAIDCIARVGYVEATTTLIVKTAKVSRGALQHHFATKADLIVAVIDRVSEELNLRFDVAALAAAPLDARVAAIVDRYWEVFTGKTFRAVLGISLGIAGEPALAKRLAHNLDLARESYGVVWQELFRDAGRTDEQLSALRRVVMSAARGFAVLKILQPRGDTNRDRSTLYDIALRELRNGSR
ncbi:MAG TPA: TetR/AcrR family transcriptional regulator [Candidatus Lustribacter sp.]|nr:TetR/AcrR family transcriptional regulator [Candidatus Lustribacter sp.]